MGENAVKDGVDEMNEDGYYEENNVEINEYEDEEEENVKITENVDNLENNAWVWQLLILSFSLGVCSCLCYYATKVKPSRGVYDFSHGQKGKYSKVSFESAHSA